MKYAVCKNGIFKSIQGEGYNCGKSAVFIRLAGCETNGMNKIDYNLDWITCSPKNEKVNIKEVNELKFVVDKSCEEMNLFIDAVSSNVKHDYVYLQPESNKNSMISNCVEMISENSDYRLSLQIHKIIGIE